MQVTEPDRRGAQVSVAAGLGEDAFRIALRKHGYDEVTVDGPSDKGCPASTHVAFNISTVLEGLVHHKHSALHMSGIRLFLPPATTVKVQLHVLPPGLPRSYFVACRDTISPL